MTNLNLCWKTLPNLNLKRPLLPLLNLCLKKPLLNPHPCLKAKMKNLARSIDTSTAWGTSK